MKVFHCTFLCIQWDMPQFCVYLPVIYNLLACKLQTSKPASLWEGGSDLRYNKWWWL